MPEPKQNGARVESILAPALSRCGGGILGWERYRTRAGREERPEILGAKPRRVVQSLRLRPVRRRGDVPRRSSLAWDLLEEAPAA